MSIAFKSTKPAITDDWSNSRNAAIEYPKKKKLCGRRKKERILVKNEMDKFLMPKNKRKEKPCHHNSQTARKRGTNSCNGESKLPDVFTYIPTLIISAGSIKENG